jgi:hypothetical protein
VKELQHEKERQKYINDLIEQGYIAPDGKTVFATSLDDIAEFLFTKIESVTPELLINTFVQSDGSAYSLRTAQEAVKRTKLSNAKIRTKTHKIAMR